MKIRVEATAYNSKPVNFLIVESRELGPKSTGLERNARYPGRERTWRYYALIILILGAVGLAWHSVSRGQADRRGAACIGLVSFMSVIVFTLLTGDPNGHVFGFFDLLMKGMHHGLAVGVLLTIYYLALEPHVRRAWPETMISWSRMLAGRFGDSLVGYHVLVGLVIGVTTALFNFERYSLMRMFDHSEGRPLLFTDTALEALRGPIGSLGALVEIAVDTSQQSMMVVVVLVLLLMILRSRRLAAIGLVVVMAVVFNQEERVGTLWQILGIVGTTLIASALVFGLVRYGFVTMAVAVIINAFLVNFPFSLSPDVWYSGNTLLSLVVVGGASLFAYRGATRGVQS